MTFLVCPYNWSYLGPSSHSLDAVRPANAHATGAVRTVLSNRTRRIKPGEESSLQIPRDQLGAKA